MSEAEKRTMDQRHRYKNPPIEEALCEFRFNPGEEWDLTIPGKLQTEFGDEYSGKPREQKAVQVGLDFQDGKPSNLQYGEGLARVQIVTKDGNRMIGVGRDALSIHMLHPYHDPHCPDRSGWDEFKPRISAALDAYWRVAKPEGVCRIGIRYINKIVIPGETVRVERYLKCALPEVDILPDRLTNFISRSEYIYDDSVRLILSQGSIISQMEPLSFLLDVDVISESIETVNRNMALEMVDDLHTRVENAFEALITDKARELFNAD